jgi:hypothetical protein
MALPLGSILTKAIERLPTQSQGLLPLDDPKNWVPLKEAAHILHVSRRTVVRMCVTINPSTGRAYLRYWRPTPGTMMICRRSLEEFCRLTQSDSEFWENRGKEVKPLSPRGVTGSRRRSRAGRVQKYPETQTRKKCASSEYKG